MDINQFLGIIRNMDRRPFRPHRYLALLAILDIIEKQENPNNKFYYDDDFKSYFLNHFCKYHSPNDNCNSFKPFFHLKNAQENGESFWFLEPRLGMASELNKLGTVNGPGKLNKIVEYAKLDQDLFDVISNKETGQESREIVRNEISQCLKAGRQTKL